MKIKTPALTPAALEEPSAYLDTAIMEMMKKIMEAVTHLMKSLREKKRNIKTLYLLLPALRESFSGTFLKCHILKNSLTIRGQRKPLNLSLNLLE